MQQQMIELQELQLQRDLAGQSGGFTFRSSREGDTGVQSFYEGGRSSGGSGRDWRRPSVTTTTTESSVSNISSSEGFDVNWRGSWRGEVDSGDASNNGSSSSSRSSVTWKRALNPSSSTAAGAGDPEKPLHIPDSPAAWTQNGSFKEEYPKGFIFTDRWYKLGDRWYRFADEGFVVTAGFREHTAYPYAYRDILQVEQVAPQPEQQQGREVVGEGGGVEACEGVVERCSRGGGSSGAETVELRVTVRVTLPPASSDDVCSAGTARVQKTLIMKDVELCGSKGDGVCTIMRFLNRKMVEAQENAFRGS
jgi:hypothetical protein